MLISVICFWMVFIILTIIENGFAVAPDLPSTRLSHSRTSKTSTVASDKETIKSVEECPLKCRCYIQESRLIVNCNHNQLTSFPPHIHSSTVELYLSRNQLTSLDYNINLKLKILNISNNNISQINKDWISSLQNLQSLDVSANSLQSGVLENAFSNLPDLYCLNLSKNKLEEITSLMFHGLSSLKTLDLSNNEIKRIDSYSFQELVSLEVINLSLNKLVNLKHEWFKNLKHLKELILRKNKLQSLSNIIFWSLKNLKILDLSENTIVSVGLLSFKGLLKLENLNMSSNNIGYMQEGVFRPLELAKVIDLSNNPLQTIDKIFIHASKLEVLYLRNVNNLKSLTPLSLAGLTKLESLYLSGAQSLSDISKSAFYGTRNLKMLDVSDGNLTTLSMGLFSKISLIEVNLKGNPWKCDCYLYWLLLWLGDHANAHLLAPSETVCHTPLYLEGHVMLDALDHNTVCTNATIRQYSDKAHFRVGSTAVLQCQVDGSPMPVLTWITPQKFTFHWLSAQNNSGFSENITIFPSNHPLIHVEDLKAPQNKEINRFLLLKSGDLLIRNIERGDGGFYRCIASNPLNNQSIAIRLTLDYEFLTNVKIVSVLVGMATSFGFLLLTLISVLIKMILKRFGIRCPCRSGKSSPKTQQIRKILESMEHYKKQQLDRLRDNYNFQVQRIKDNCMQQMEKLRESYSSQAERLRDIRDYGTLQIDRIRENYYSQVQRVRDYSTSQIERLRENYLFQRNRIRKFSTHHLYKLRENYKLQQQHLNKILENLNIESCRNVCQRTDSVIFEPDITMENVFVPKICLAQSFVKESCDSIDNSSQISAYFTPDEAGSEVSGHECDEPECYENGPKEACADALNSDFEQIVMEMTDSINITDINIPENKVSIAHQQPEVVIYDSGKMNKLNSNETIV